MHTTGSSIVEQAKRLKVDPEAFAVDFYLHAEGKYPHYLIAHDGSLYSFCDELKMAAHAAWSEVERGLYGSIANDWHLYWIDTLRGSTVAKEVPAVFYKAWRERWPYHTPVDLLRQITETPDNGPNYCTIGVELLDAKPFTWEQHDMLARLFVDICARHGLLDPKQIEPRTLPQPWLCTHSDVSPMRRWQRRKDGSGFPWDCRTDQLDWRLLESLLRGP